MNYSKIEEVLELFYRPLQEDLKKIKKKIISVRFLRSGTMKKNAETASIKY